MSTDKHEPRFEYHEDTRRIHQRPTTTENEDGSTSMSLGFPVCKVEEFITEPKGVLELMNKGDCHDDLLEALENEEVLINHCQSVLEDYLIPNSLDADEAIRQLIALLDGPDQRKTQDSARAAIKAARGTGT